MSSPISGFTAIPNPQMLAFMPIQSYLMMYFAGAGWQIGKRKISAIPNEEFNKMSANDLLKGFTADLRETIPTLESSMQDITPLVNILVKQYGDFAREIINVVPQVAQTVAGALVNPKGALIPPLFGSELEKLVSGNPTQAQFLAYAKILYQNEVDKLNASPQLGLSETEKDEALAHMKRVAEQKLQTAQNIRDQRIIEAKIRAEERKTQRAIAPSPHVIDRSRSNVSMQSLRIEKGRLLANVANATATRTTSLRNRALVGQQRINRLKRLAEAIATARQQLANFMKMHGKRF